MVMMRGRKAYKYPSVKTAELYTARRLANAYKKRNTRTGGYTGKELRFVDYDVNQAMLTDLGNGARADPSTALCLNAIAQGSGNSQRGGLRATIRSVQVRGYVKFSTATLQGIVKLYLVLDTQTNGAQLVPQELFADSPSSANFQAVNLFENLENSHRFKILQSKTVKFVTQNHYWNGTDTLAPSPCVPFTLTKSWKSGLQTRFSGTGATIADISDNSLHVVAISLDTSELNYVSRVRFYAD